MIPEKAALEEFLTRGVERIYPSKEFLHERMMEGKPLRLYLGIDPTGPTLHLGHAIILKKLRDFQKLGHEVVILIGDFTGMVGDPTDKSAARIKLSREAVLQNAKKYKKQAGKFLTFRNGGAKIHYNSKWLAKLKFEEVLELASHFTVQQFLERDMFQKRLEEKKPIYLHEFLYPLLQGYDSVGLATDGEIGGNDQTFNMLAGRTLLKQVSNKEKFVIAMRLLVDPSGKKMGKTEGNMITFDDSPEEMFGKVMSWNDEQILPAFELSTDVSSADIEKVQEELGKGVNPLSVKRRLGEEVVALFHGPRAAKRASRAFEKTFREGAAPEHTKTIAVASGTPLMEALASIASKSELRRLFAAGAVSEVGGEKIIDPLVPVTRECTVRIGKHRFMKITLG